MAELTEQQGHLQSVIAQQQDLINEINLIQAQLSSKKELLAKTQGVIEYLSQIGVTLPVPETPTVPTEETAATTPEVVK